jgi:hypothetical protein
MIIPVPTVIWRKAHQIPIIPVVPMKFSEIGLWAMISLRGSKNRIARRIKMPLRTINNPRMSKMDNFFFGGSGGLSGFFWTLSGGGGIFASSWFTLSVYGRGVFLMLGAGGIWGYGLKKGY